MFKIGIVLCAINIAAANAVHAGQAIEVEKLTKAQLADAIKAASDDTIIEFQGQNKTKAQWRSESQANYDLQGMAKMKQTLAAAKAKADAAAKALQDEQDKTIAAQNAQVTKEFDELSSQP
jgi:hypothetical protein